MFACWSRRFSILLEGRGPVIAKITNSRKSTNEGQAQITALANVALVCSERILHKDIGILIL